MGEIWAGGRNLKFEGGDERTVEIRSWASLLIPDKSGDLNWRGADAGIRRGGVFLVFLPVEGRGFEFAISERLQRLLLFFFLVPFWWRGLMWAPPGKFQTLDASRVGTTELDSNTVDLIESRFVIYLYLNGHVNGYQCSNGFVFKALFD